MTLSRWAAWFVVVVFALGLSCVSGGGGDDAGTADDASDYDDGLTDEECREIAVGCRLNTIGACVHEMCWDGERADVSLECRGQLIHERDDGTIYTNDPTCEHPMDGNLCGAECEAIHCSCITYQEPAIYREFRECRQSCHDEARACCDDNCPEDQCGGSATEGTQPCRDDCDSKRDNCHAGCCVEFPAQDYDFWREKCEA
ncbi:hypothetical protein K8I61_19240 [bacterium]|nr:hypothetical protein [bacterium]